MFGNEFDDNPSNDDTLSVNDLEKALWFTIVISCINDDDIDCRIWRLL
jgi:hypothetical protein